MSKSVRGLFSHGMVVVVALLATIVVFAPCAAHATESPEVADRIAESLYVPEGVEGGIKVNDEGLSSGVAPEYGRLETGGGVSELAELPRSYDLRGSSGRELRVPREEPVSLAGLLGVRLARIAREQPSPAGSR